jgi:hypothetical protein
MAFVLHFFPSGAALAQWSYPCRTFDHLLTAVKAERALGARDDELFVSCKGGLTPEQNDELLRHGAQLITNRSE